MGQYRSESTDKARGGRDAPAVRDGVVALGEDMALARSQISVLSLSYA